MTKQNSKPTKLVARLFGMAVISYIAIWLWVMFLLTGARQAVYPLGVYGGKIEAGRYYLQVEKNRQVFKEVTRKQYEDVDRTGTNAGIALFVGMAGFLVIMFGGGKLGWVEFEPNKPMTTPDV